MLSLRDIGTEEQGALGKLRLALVLKTVLNKPPLWSSCAGRTAFLQRICHHRKSFVRSTLPAKAALSARCQKTTGASLEADAH